MFITLFYTDSLSVEVQVFLVMINTRHHSLSITNTHNYTSCPQNEYVLLKVAVVGKQLVYSSLQ